MLSPELAIPHVRPNTGIYQDPNLFKDLISRRKTGKTEDVQEPFGFTEVSVSFVAERTALEHGRRRRTLSNAFRLRARWSSNICVSGYVDL